MTEVDGNNNKTLFKYLGWTFGLGWGIQVVVWLISRNAVVDDPTRSLLLSSVAQAIMSAMMFVPMISVLLSGEKLKGMGWKPWVKGNVGSLLFAWFMPTILTVIGTALFFLIFPALLDLTGAAIVDSVGPEALEQLESQGVSYVQYILVGVISSITYAPLLNMIFAVGEEAGWRGYMYPVLKERFGRLKGSIFGGIIWGMWHWPLIMLTGYEYGTGYRGFPTLGMVVFCIFTVAIGILCDYVYEKSDCIWFPAILHGAINAIATVPMLMITSEAAPYRLLGPTTNGLVAGIPLIICAAVLLFGKKKNVKEVME